MSHNSQPVVGAHGSTRNVVGSATINTSAAPSISGMPNPPPDVNTGNTVRCEVSLASMVVVMEQPLSSEASASARHQRLAAQDAVLVRKRQPDHLELLLFDDVGAGERAASFCSADQSP